MSDFQPRQPKGSPTGGQFSTASRGETGTTLGASPAEPRDQVQALSDLLDAYLAGDPVYADETAAIAQIAPHVPARISSHFWQDALVAQLNDDLEARDAALQQLATWDARDARWRNDPAFTSPTYDVTEEGANGPVVYTTAVGGKYTGFRDVASVAKDVRGDLKAAQAAGFLPEGLTFSVVTDNYSGGQAMHVTVRGLTDDDIYEDDPTSWSSGRRLSPVAIEVKERVEAIAGAYDRSTTDVQTDYFNVMYWHHVDLEDEQGAAWRAQQAAERKAARGGAR